MTVQHPICILCLVTLAMVQVFENSEENKNLMKYLNTVYNILPYKNGNLFLSMTLLSQINLTAFLHDSVSCLKQLAFF